MLPKGIHGPSCSCPLLRTFLGAALWLWTEEIEMGCCEHSQGARPPSQRDSLLFRDLQSPEPPASFSQSLFPPPIPNLLCFGCQLGRFLRPPQPHAGMSEAPARSPGVCLLWDSGKEGALPPTERHPSAVRAWAFSTTSKALAKPQAPTATPQVVLEWLRLSWGEALSCLPRMGWRRFSGSPYLLLSVCTGLLKLV